MFNVEVLIRQTRGFEQRYGMSSDSFEEYLHTRSALLTSDDLEPAQNQRLGQALMREVDDWLGWKAAQKMPDDWLS